MSIAFSRRESRARPLGRRNASPFPYDSDSLTNAYLNPFLSARQASTCVCDTNKYKPTCPTCPSGQVCRATLIPLDCGRSCLSNTCESDGSSPSSGGSSNGATIGGAVGGALGVLAVAALLFLLWRRKDKKKRALKIQERNEAKVKAAAGEKFRPGQHKRLSSGPGSSSGPPSVHSGTDARSGRTAAANLDDVEEVDEEDVEYTELRPDGLTTYKRGEDEQDTLGALVGMGVNRRYSTSAATHLSRISEGFEGDDDEDTLDSRSIRAGSVRTGRFSVRRKMFGGANSAASVRNEDASTMPHHNPAFAASSSSLATSSNSGVATAGSASGAPHHQADEHAVHGSSGGPSDGSGAVNAQLLPIGATPSARKMNKNAAPTKPTPAHRQAGAPLVELNSSRNAPQRGPGARSPPTGTILDLDAPLSPMMALDARSEHGEDEGPLTGGSALDPYGPRQSGWYSPAAPSTAASRHFGFMDNDPAARDAAYDELMAGRSSYARSVKSIPESALVRSESGHDGPDVEIPELPTPSARAQYAHNSNEPLDRHMSSGTSMSSGSSVSMDYFNPSSLITPMTPGTAKRVQVGKSGGRAEVIRVPSSGSKKGGVRSKRYNSTQVEPGTGVDMDDLASPPMSSEGHDPFDEERAVPGQRTRAAVPASASGSNLSRATSGRTDATAGTGGRHLSTATTASFGIPILDGSRYAQGLPLHSFIDPSGHEDRPLSWFDEDGQPIEMDEEGHPLEQDRVAGMVAANGQRYAVSRNQVRQSTASSIGGLSVFDGIPFHVEHGEMPANAAVAIAAARAREAQGQDARRADADEEQVRTALSPPSNYGLTPSTEQSVSTNSSDRAYTSSGPSTANATAGTRPVSGGSDYSQSSTVTARAPPVTGSSITVASAMPTGISTGSSTGASGSSQATRGTSAPRSASHPLRQSEEGGLDDYDFKM